MHITTDRPDTAREVVRVHSTAGRRAHRTTARSSRATTKAGRPTEGASRSEQPGMDASCQNAPHPKIMSLESAFFVRDQHAPLTPRAPPLDTALEKAPLVVLQTESVGGKKPTPHRSQLTTKAEFTIPRRSGCRTCGLQTGAT